MSQAQGTEEVEFAYLAAWAAKHGAALQTAGEVGFGRECVGITIGNSYLDYGHMWDSYGNDVEFWTPEDSYHKHPCLAVLGRGPAAMHQLYEWVHWLDDHGWTVEIEDRRPIDMLDELLHGTSTPKLVRAVTE